MLFSSLQRQCCSRMHDEKRLFFIFHLIDSKKQELAPVTNCFYCMNHILSGIDQSSDVQMSRGVHHIIDSAQSWEDKAAFFFPHYCRWMPHPAKSRIFTIFLSVRKCCPVVVRRKCQRGLAVSQRRGSVRICGPSYSFTTSMSIDHRCCQPQLWSIDCSCCQRRYWFSYISCSYIEKRSR